ncbi:MAG: hypothetical protein LBE64_22915, partial [Acinetobacter pittii]|nr:hypothetical protein [Acinetobacter pittii]
MRQYSLSFDSLIGSFIDAPTRRVAGAQWGCTQENREKRTETKKMQKSKVKNNEMENYQVASPSELFFVDLNGRIILIGSHCLLEAEESWKEKRILLFFRGRRGGKRTG